MVAARAAKDSLSLGQVADLAETTTMTSKNNLDVVRLNFTSTKQVSEPELKAFLVEHLKNLPH